MGSKYSEIREKLNFVIDRKTTDDLAHLTHYLQNSKNGISKYYKPTAKAYLESIKRDLELDEKLNLRDLVPKEWDVPFPTPTRTKFKFIDLFAGIGGLRLAFQNNGGKSVFSSEWDPFAKKTYETNFGEVPFGDITQISESNIPDHDILVGGFPCQPFSIAGVSKKNSLGRQHGFLDKTQGTLFFDIARIIERKRPKAFMLENVKNLVSHDKGRTFKIINETLESLEYSVHAKVMDARNYVPQHRERIIIVGYDKKIYGGKEGFKFPEPKQIELSIGTILEPKVLEKYTLSDKLWTYLQDYKKKHQAKGNGFGFGLTNLNGVSRTLSARYYKDGAEILIPQGTENPRRLTPRECARLQGFPDNFQIPVSDNQGYKQFGNSVAVPLMQAIAKNVVKNL